MMVKWTEASRAARAAKMELIMVKAKKTTGENAWLSPTQVMDTLYDVREPGCDAVGYALLRPRAKDVENQAGLLIRSKLAPVRPTSTTATTECGIPITARQHRLVLARGVADVSLATLLDGYDDAIRSHQRLLAAVLTVRGDQDRPVHDLVDMASTYAAIHLACRRSLTSVVITHVPGDELSHALPHVHICVLARQHTASGWGAEHPDLTDTQHRLWADEWTAFRDGWEQVSAAA